MAKTKKKVMQITRERALKLFSYFNYKTAGKWSSKRMEGKLAKLPESVDISLVKNSRVEAILKDIANASSVEVITADKKKDKTETKSTKKKATKKTTAEPVSKKKKTKKTASKKTGKKKKSRFSKKKQTKGAKGKTTSAKIDQFGSREGSNGAVLNACLSKKAKTMQQLMKESKLKSTCYNHLAKLIKNGFVEKTDKGYKLT